MDSTVKYCTHRRPVDDRCGCIVFVKIGFFENNSTKRRRKTTFFQPKVIFFARRCAKIKNIPIFALPKQPFVARLGIDRGYRRTIRRYPKQGKMAERSNAPHSKCGVRVTVPGVRIPLFPLRIRTIQGKTLQELILQGFLFSERRSGANRAAILVDGSRWIKRYGLLIIRNCIEIHSQQLPHQPYFAHFDR